MFYKKEKAGSLRPPKKGRQMLKLKLLLLAGGTFSLFGCCQVLGICTSASIHTSIPSQQQFVEQRGLQTLSPQFPMVTTPTDSRPMPELSEARLLMSDAN
jgi:hypothetical protein